VGWEYTGAADQQQDAGEFFSFLYGGLSGQLIRTTRKTFTGALPDNSDKGHEENMTLLPIGLYDAELQQEQSLNLNTLLDTFFYENVASGLRRKLGGQEQEVWALNTYAVENVPSIVAVSLKRFDENLLKIECQVDFPSQINLHKYSGRPEWRSSPVMHSVAWNLRSIVCHRGGSTQSGHYYAYTRYSQHDSSSAIWLRMDDAGSPCITQTNVWADPYVKSEAVLFLYELDTDAHTAALMMLQEDSENDGGLGLFGTGMGMGGMGGMGQGYHSSTRSTFGSGSTNKSTKTSNNTIPAALDPTFLSNVLNAVASSSSHRPSAASNNTPAKPNLSASAQGKESNSGPSGSGAAGEGKESNLEGSTFAASASLSDSNQTEEPKIVAAHSHQRIPEEDENKGGRSSTSQAGSGSDSIATSLAFETTLTPQAGSEGLPPDEAFLVAANGNPSVRTRRRVDEEGTKTGDLETWTAELQLEGQPDREPLLAISALPSFSWEGRPQQQATVTISELADGKADSEAKTIKTTVLDSEHPTSILSLGSGLGEWPEGRFSVAIEVPKRR